MTDSRNVVKVPGESTPEGQQTKAKSITPRKDSLERPALPAEPKSGAPAGSLPAAIQTLISSDPVVQDAAEKKRRNSRELENIDVLDAASGQITAPNSAAPTPVAIDRASRQSSANGGAALTPKIGRKNSIDFNPPGYFETKAPDSRDVSRGDPAEGASPDLLTQVLQAAMNVSVGGDSTTPGANSDSVPNTPAPTRLYESQRSAAIAAAMAQNGGTSPANVFSPPTPLDDLRAAFDAKAAAVVTGEEKLPTPPPVGAAADLGSPPATPASSASTPATPAKHIIYKFLDDHRIVVEGFEDQGIFELPKDCTFISTVITQQEKEELDRKGNLENYTIPKRMAEKKDMVENGSQHSKASRINGINLLYLNKEDNKYHFWRIKRGAGGKLVVEDTIAHKTQAVFLIYLTKFSDSNDSRLILTFSPTFIDHMFVFANFNRSLDPVDNRVVGAGELYFINGEFRFAHNRSGRFHLSESPKLKDLPASKREQASAEQNRTLLLRFGFRVVDADQIYAYSPTIYLAKNTNFFRKAPKKTADKALEEQAERFCGEQPAAESPRPPSRCSVM